MFVPEIVANGLLVRQIRTKKDRQTLTSSKNLYLKIRTNVVKIGEGDRKAEKPLTVGK